MKHVMPTLSQGLVECTKIRPGDPVDFLVSFHHHLVWVLFCKKRLLPRMTNFQ